MVLPLIAGAAMVAGGTGINMYQSERRRKAMRGALSNYESALGGEEARQRALIDRQVDTFGNWAGQDLTETGGTIGSILGRGESWQQNPADFAKAVEAAKAQAAAGGSGMAPGTAQGQWLAATMARQAPAQQRLERGLTRNWQEAGAADSWDATMLDRTIKRLVAQRSRADTLQRMALDDQIAKLAWARQQRMLQARMNQAAETGAEAQAWGSLLTGAGGSVAGMGGSPGK